MVASFRLCKAFAVEIVLFAQLEVKSEIKKKLGLNTLYMQFFLLISTLCLSIHWC